MGLLLQGVAHSHAMKLQIYLDDPIWLLARSIPHRAYILAMQLLTVCALRLKISWVKRLQSVRVLLDWR